MSHVRLQLRTQTKKIIAVHPHAAHIISNQIYIDDVFPGADTIEEEASIIQLELINFLNLGGFEQRKYSSSHFSLLYNITKESLNKP